MVFGTSALANAINSFRSLFLLPLLFMVLVTSLSRCVISRKATLSTLSHNNSVRTFGNLSIELIDSLMTLYGNNKIFLDKYLEPSLIALSYYPELASTHIEFIYSKEKTTMSVRPVVESQLSSQAFLRTIH